MREKMNKVADEILKESDRMELGDILIHRITQYMREHDYYESGDDVIEALRKFETYILDSILPIWLEDQMP